MATEDKPIYEQVADLMESWNPAPTNSGLSNLIGEQADRRDPVMDHDRNFGRSDLDAERLSAMSDDGDDDDEDGDDLDDLNIKELRARVDEVNEGMEDEEDHLSKGGSADDIRQRLRDHDSESDEDDEDDESEDDDDE